MSSDQNQVEKYMQEAGIEGEVTQVESGNVCTTYRIEGEEIYFLQYTEHPENLRRGILGLQLQQDTDIPVPQIEYSDLEEPLLVTEAVPGETLEEREDEEIYRQAGQILAELHTQDHEFQHYGLLDEKDGELHSEGRDWFSSYNNLHRQHMRSAEELLPQKTVWEIDRYFFENRDSIDRNPERSIGHLDFKPDNIIAEDTINGIIDWDMIRVTDPDLELLKTTQTLKRKDKPAQTFLNGYTQNRTPAMNPQVHDLYQLTAHLSRISELDYLKKQHNRQPKKEEIQQTQKQIEKILHSEIGENKRAG